MRLDIVPKSRLGKWAVRFGIVLVVLMALQLVFAIAIGGNPAVIENSPLLTILAGILSVALNFAGPLSFIIGIVAIFKHKEWVVLKILAILYVLTILMFTFGEFLFPH